MIESPPAGSVQIDMGRVVQRSTQALAGSTAVLAAELGMAQEVSDARAARIVELEQTLADRDAELGRLRQSDELLQQRIRELEEANAERESLPPEEDQG